MKFVQVKVIRVTGAAEAQVCPVVGGQLCYYSSSHERPRLLNKDSIALAPSAVHKM